MRKPLSELEHLVMDFVWSKRASTAEDIRLGLAGKKDLTDSTVRTILRRLEDKGYLRHKVSGRAFLYEGAEAPNHVAVSAVRGIIDRFCGGSVEELLVGMVENEVVDGAELKRLAGRIAAKKRK